MDSVIHSVIYTWVSKVVLLHDILLHVTSSSVDYPVTFNYRLSQNLSPPIFFVFSSFHLHCPHHGHSSVTVTVRCHETNKKQPTNQQTSRASWWHSSSVFGRSWIQISTQCPVSLSILVVLFSRVAQITWH